MPDPVDLHAVARVVGADVSSADSAGAGQNAEVLPFVVGNECAVPMMLSHGGDPLLSAVALAALPQGVGWQGNPACYSQ